MKVPELKKIKAAELADIMQARPISRVATDGPSGISHDSRNIAEGDLFFAIQGESFDGHEFVEEAFDRGAWGAVVSKDTDAESEDRIVLRVEDTVKAPEQDFAWEQDNLPKGSVDYIEKDGKLIVTKVSYKGQAK